MRDLRSLDARGVIRAYLVADARRCYPPSLAGYEPDMPRAPSPALPSGYFEQLCRLMVGVRADALTVLRMRDLGWDGHVLRPCMPEYWSESPEEELRAELLPCARSPGPAEIARALGMSAGDVRRLVREAEAQVAENLGRAKRSEREAS